MKAAITVAAMMPELTGGSLECASLLALSRAYKAAASCRTPDINEVMH